MTSNNASTSDTPFQKYKQARGHLSCYTPSEKYVYGIINRLFSALIDQSSIVFKYESPVFIVLHTNRPACIICIMLHDNLVFVKTDRDELNGSTSIGVKV